MFIFWIGQVAVTFGFILLFLKKILHCLYVEVFAEGKEEVNTLNV